MRIAIVSGATSGIGLKIVERLVSLDVFTVLLGRNITKLKRIHEKIGEKGAYYCVDIKDVKAVEECVNNIIDTYKRIDLLVNCAGVGEFSSIEELKYDELKNIIDTNLIGTIMLSQNVASQMMKQKSGQIINIESIAAIKGFEYGTAYVASKFGMAGFSQVLWAELKKYEIKVCSIRPGLVNTDLFRNMHDRAGIDNALDPDDIAYLVEMVVNQPEKSNISVVEVRPIKKEAQNLFYELVKNEVDYKKRIKND